MVKEKFLIESEKMNLFHKLKNHIVNAIENSNKTLEKIIKKRLLPHKEAAQKNYEHYLKEVEKIEHEIKKRIVKDEESSTKRRLTNWKKIQHLRDKAYTLNAFWQPTITSSNNVIDKFDIIKEIKCAKDKDTKKYQDKVFKTEKVLNKFTGSFGIPFCKILSDAAEFIKYSDCGSILTIAFCILLAIADFIFIITKSIDIPVLIPAFLVCAFITLNLFGIVVLIQDKIGLDREEIPQKAIGVYTFYLGWIVFCTASYWVTFGYIEYHPDCFIKFNAIEFTNIIPPIIVMLLPWIIRLVLLCPIRIMGFIGKCIFDRHHNVYKQYYNSLIAFNHDIEWAYSIIKEKADEIKKTYFLDHNLFSAPEKIYASIINEYDSWAKNHALIPQNVLLTPPNLSYSLIASRKEKKMPKCNHCGYPYFTKGHTSTNKDWSHAKKRIEREYSGGYYENQDTSYDIEVDGQKIGTATSHNRYYIPTTLEKETTYYEVPITETTLCKCPFCGNSWNIISHSTKAMSEIERTLHYM